MDILRRLALLVLLLGMLPHAQAQQTYSTCPAWVAAQSWACVTLVNAYATHPNGPATCRDFPESVPGVGQFQLRISGGCTGGPDACWGFAKSYDCRNFQPDNNCQAGANPLFGGVDTTESTFCGSDNCEYECRGDDGTLSCLGIGVGDDPVRTFGTWSQSGDTCGSADPDVPDDDCIDVGTSGFTFCPSDPQGCVRSPSGTLLCPSAPGPDCATAPSGAACYNDDPPEGYGPPEDVRTCPSVGPCFNITVAPPDEPDACDPLTDPNQCEEPPVCPANDPDCEEDDECPAGFTGTPPDCEKEDNDGICTEDDQTVCDILRDIREAAQAVESTTKLQLDEDQETNAKLSQIITDAKEAAETSLEQAKRLQAATDSVRKAVNTQGANIAGKVQSGSDDVRNAVVQVKDAVQLGNSDVIAAMAGLSGNLSAIEAAIDGSSPCGGSGEPPCSDAEGIRDLIDPGTLDQSGDFDNGLGQSDLFEPAGPAPVVASDAGFFGSGQRDCPVIPDVVLPWGTVEMPFDLLCSVFAILAALIVIGGYAQAAYIIGGAR